MIRLTFGHDRDVARGLLAGLIDVALEVSPDGLALLWRALSIFIILLVHARVRFLSESLLDEFLEALLLISCLLLVIFTLKVLIVFFLTGDQGGIANLLTLVLRR